MRTLICSIAILFPCFAQLASADDLHECACKNLSISGTLPSEALGVLEVDASLASTQHTVIQRPIIAVDLSRAGYPGQSLYLRFSKLALHGWQVEVLSVDPRLTKDAKSLATFTPLSFSDEGQMINELRTEVRLPSAQTEDRDRLILAFRGLKESPRQTDLSVESATTEACPCYEAPKEVIGLEELKRPEFQMKIYRHDEGLAAMLKDRPVPDDK